MLTGPLTGILWVSDTLTDADLPTEVAAALTPLREARTAASHHLVGGDTLVI